MIMKQNCSMIAILMALVILLGCSTAVADVPQAGSTITFGNYQQDFPCDPIKWNVLATSGTHAMLMSSRILECMPYDNDSSDWRDSSLRNWLNGEFLTTAFTTDERSMILSNSDGDKVTIPTLGEMTAEVYGFLKSKNVADTTRIAEGTALAVSHGMWTKQDSVRGSYFTRTPSSGDTAVYQVKANGDIGVANVARDNVGVRVVVYVDFGE